MTRPALAVDTAPWIYWIEEHPDFLPAVKSFLEPALRGEELVVVSVLVLHEVMTGAYARGDEKLASAYGSVFLGASSLLVLEVDAPIALEAARLRAAYGLRAPDAIHIATALVAGAPVFLTTDRRLARVKEIDVRVLRPRPPKRKR